MHSEDTPMASGVDVRIEEAECFGLAVRRVYRGGELIGVWMPPDFDRVLREHVIPADGFDQVTSARRTAEGRIERSRWVSDFGPDVGAKLQIDEDELVVWLAATTGRSETNTRREVEQWGRDVRSPNSPTRRILSVGLKDLLIRTLHPRSRGRRTIPISDDAKRAATRDHLKFARNVHRALVAFERKGMDTAKFLAAGARAALQRPMRARNAWWFDHDRVSLLQQAFGESLERMLARARLPPPSEIAYAIAAAQLGISAEDVRRVHLQRSRRV